MEIPVKISKLNDKLFDIQLFTISKLSVIHPKIKIKKISHKIQIKIGNKKIQINKIDNLI
jgi:hypothetical protein